MTDEQILQLAEQHFDYQGGWLNPDYEYPHHNWDIFEDGSDYGEIMFARTLLECIEVDYYYPWSDGK